MIFEATKNPIYNYKKIGIACTICMISINLFSQLSTVNHWETIIHSDTIFRYQTNKDNMTDPNWRDNDYEDSMWHEGHGGIGYGDDDDNTVINSITSVFLRRQFTIIDKSEVAAAILNIDYDDAFVAYLNGVEIARSAGLNDPFPAFNILSSQQHDAVIPDGGTPPNIIIDLNKLQTNLLTGTNTLAVQVHNASTTSSDLSSNLWLSLGLNVTTERYLPTPAWFTEPDIKFSSNLPILIINTENGQTIRDEPKINAHLGIIYNGPGERNYSDEAFTEYDGNIGIEIRGNSTSGFPKKPYNFETRDNFGENLNVPLLGMPAENDWVLRASYIDHTFLRNPLADYMSRQTGYWASRTRHVEVVLNEQYQGIYLLMEKVKRDNNRVDIARLDSTEDSGEDLTGGYIWEITGFADHFGERRKLKYPNINDVNPVQLEYIKSVDDAFRNKMRNSSSVYADPNTGYVEHIWAESFIYEVIIQEAMRNSDAYGWSGLYHKDKNGLINAGPVWDFDQSAGNSSYPDNGVVDGWLIGHPNTSSTPFYWPLLLNDPYFKYSVSVRWKELRRDKFLTNKLFSYIDSIASLLSEAQEREFKKWPVLGKSVWRETYGYDQRNTYQKEVDYLKEFLTERWLWLDSQLATVQKPAGYPEITITNVVPDMKDFITRKKAYLNLNDIFSYPYKPKLKYSAHSTDTSIIIPDVKKSDSLKLEFNGIGFSDISITATDIYGNKKKTGFNFEVAMSTTDISEINNDIASRFTLFPNPASDNINIELLGDSNIDIELYSYTGQLIDIIFRGPNPETINYNCSRLENGVYFVRLKTEKGNVHIHKLIINK